MFVQKIASVDIVTAASEFEALLLEARFIHELKPKYNSRLRDDKSPLYIVITTDEEFPRVLTKRRGDLSLVNKKSTILGPFLSTRQVTLILKKARRLFPYCNQGFKTGKPCFYQHLGLCPGVCIGTVSRQEYREMMRRLIHFLRGDFGKLRQILIQEMEDASGKQHYEEAALKKNLIEALDRTLKLSFSSEEEILQRQQPKSIASILKTLASSGYNPEPTTYNLFRIEGYDISNLRGRQATGSMVVFTNGIANSSEYRTFRIRGEDSYTSDDPRMLAEVLRRRLLHPEWDKPHLVLIDGGEPQLRQIQNEFKVTTQLPKEIPFIGLAKEKEILVIPRNDGEFSHLRLAKNNSGLLLLMHIRDESHRFSRVYHHWLRKKALLG